MLNTQTNRMNDFFCQGVNKENICALFLRKQRQEIASMHRHLQMPPICVLRVLMQGCKWQGLKQAELTIFPKERCNAMWTFHSCSDLSRELYDYIMSCTNCRRHDLGIKRPSFAISFLMSLMKPFNISVSHLVICKEFWIRSVISNL